MEELFTKDTLAMVFSLLEKVSEGSVTVLVSYFALPALMLLITTTAWLYFGVTLTKMLHSVATKFINAERTTITKVTMQYGCINTESFAVFKEVIDSVNDVMGTEYIHDSGAKWLQQAVENQKVLDKEHGKSKYTPYVYCSTKGEPNGKTK